MDRLRRARRIGFGLQPGDELDVETTICDEIREQRTSWSSSITSRRTTAYCEHPTPEQYGFESYISVPITLPDGRFFGTLCALDPRPARV